MDEDVLDSGASSPIQYNELDDHAGDWRNWQTQRSLKAMGDRGGSNPPFPTNKMGLIIHARPHVTSASLPAELE